MRQLAIISESIALLSMTKISFYLYIIMYQFWLLMCNS
ncbi:putative membrane protein [Vibrio cholerae HC-61A2]|nr:putative membrane protein [Vibrio cholerae HC-02A1]EKG53354.1 putative membrane protein [Vibrio cholerae HC-50A1]EKG57999.1 putative membrane protein [Vibrio cholerae HC-52A1]EKG63706.1 putative membrane protein [Vibrio cholerae HC-56A1]EKG64128.1 putative membrane protein [Vibrio cholerae HC-55A1]EKG66099.1 putative membrane protein [Vibrio cholerae HC-57A1]EKL08642.1 putative membrane protein [Vibrio cholerae HC-55C2]EKL15396.1 putative membrane protein [Vibrio cholerae HC-60A1]EKL1639